MVKNILGVNAFFMINKKLVELCGFESALFLAILADANDIFEGEWIYQTRDTVLRLSCNYLTRRKQEVAIANLVELGIIEQKNFGMPLMRYFRINEDRLLEVIK